MEGTTPKGTTPHCGQHEARLSITKMPPSPALKPRHSTPHPCLTGPPIWGVFTAQLRGQRPVPATTKAPGMVSWRCDDRFYNLLDSINRGRVGLALAILKAQAGVRLGHAAPWIFPTAVVPRGVYAGAGAQIHPAEGAAVHLGCHLS